MEAKVNKNSALSKIPARKFDKTYFIELLH